MTPQQLIDTATRHQVLLEGLKTGMVTDFQGVFDKLDNTVADILNSLRVDKLDEITRGALEGVLSHLETSQITVMDEAINHYLKQLPGVAGYVGNFEANALRSVLTPDGQKNVQTPPAVKAYEEAMKRPVRATGDLLKPLVDKWGRGAIQRTNNAVRNGYEQGTTVPQIIKNLMGTRPMNYNDGVTAINKRQAATVVRTSVQHVAATAREVTYEENSDLVKGVTWVSTLDSHTTTQCRSLDGHHFPLESGPRPPIHPNCRSTTAPDLNEAFDFLDKGATRSSANGYVDADLTYYDWLKTQSPEFQDTVLGPTRGELLRSGGLSSSEFSDLQLDKNFQPRTLAEMKQVDPVAFQRAGLDPNFTPTPPPPDPVPTPARPPAPEPKPEPVVDRATLQSVIDRLLGQTHMTFEDVQALQAARDALSSLPPPTPPAPAPTPAPPPRPPEPIPPPRTGQDVVRDFSAFANRHPNDVSELTDAARFLNTSEAGSAAMKAFSSGAFGEINLEPENPVSQAMLREVGLLPNSTAPQIHRVLAFETDRDRDLYLATLHQPQGRTFTSWTTEDPRRQTIAQNIGRDVASQFGDKVVVLTVDGPIGAKDVSFFYGAESQSGGELLMTRGAIQKVKSIEMVNGEVHVTLESVTRIPQGPVPLPTVPTVPVPTAAGSAAESAARFLEEYRLRYTVNGEIDYSLLTDADRFLANEARRAFKAAGGVLDESGFPVRVAPKPIPTPKPIPAPTPKAAPVSTGVPVRAAKGSLGTNFQTLDKAVLKAQGIDLGESLGISQQDFHAFFGMNPVDLKNLLVKDIEGTGLSNVQLKVWKYGKNITFELKDESSSFYMKRMFGKTSVSHEYFRLPTNLQGGDIGKILLRNQLSLYDHLGTKTITVHANIDVGGYAWARYGFTPAPGSWNKLQSRFSKALEGLEQRGMSDASLSAIEKILARNDPQDIRLIAAMKELVARPYTTDTMPVGKQLLLGSDWLGKIDLTKREDYGIFASYLKKNA